MSEHRHRIGQILEEADDRLAAARAGLGVVKSGPYQLKAGFRNVAVFGRMVTFVTNNLRDKLDGFEEWDAAAKERHFGDGLGRLMNDMRLAFEKQATNPIASHTHIKHFDSSMMQKFPKPEGAVAFFMGDKVGGSGWMIETPDGAHIPYYIDLPGDVAEVTVVAVNKNQSYDLIELAERYISALESYMGDLKVFAHDQIT